MKKSIKSFHDGKSGAAITLALRYGADVTKVIKIEKDGTIFIDLINPKSGKKADQELLQYLARQFQIEGKNLEVLAGTDENKLISIVDILPKEVDQILQSLL